jgi:hypothetical protein
MKIRIVAVLALKYLFGFGLLYFVFKMGQGFDFSVLKPIFKWQFFAFITACKLLAVTVTVFRWQLILKLIHGPVKAKKLYELSFVGTAMSYVMPGAISGDVVKAVFLKNEVKDLRKISVSIIFDRIAGLSSIFILMVLSAVVLFQTRKDSLEKVFELVQGNKLTGIGIFVGLFLLGLLGIYWFNKKFYQKLQEPLRELTLIRKQIPTLVLMSCLSQAILIFCYFVLYHAIAVETLGFFEMAFVFCFASLAIVLPITPGGLGVGQMVFNFLFSVFLGFNSTIGATMFSILQIFDLIFIVPGVLLIFLELNIFRPKT